MEKYSKTVPKYPALNISKSVPCCFLQDISIEMSTGKPENSVVFVIPETKVMICSQSESGDTCITGI
jgi:hypothetical protein